MGCLCSLQDEIKKAYRGLALTAHPDKQAAMKPDEAKKATGYCCHVLCAHKSCDSYDSARTQGDCINRATMMTMSSVHRLSIRMLRSGSESSRSRA